MKTPLHHRRVPRALIISWLTTTALCLIAGCVDGDLAPSQTAGDASLRDAEVQIIGDAAPTPPPPPPPSGPMRCLDVDRESLPPCCDADEAHCVPTGLIPDGFRNLVGECAGGFCVPDKILEARGEVALQECQAFGQPGRCLSVCIPRVSEQAALLPDDICDPGEKCVPCVSPLDGMETGVCDTLSCGGMQNGNPMPPPPPGPMYSCEDPPAEPIIDPSTFPPCCDGAHCVPQAAVPADQRDVLGQCDDGRGLCLPDVFIESGGFYTPATCDSGGTEGRCLSVCLPQVERRAELLRRDICAADERCIPCCDPRTGEDTGVCGRACDEPYGGICEEPIRCCAGFGTCLNEGAVPDDLRSNVKDCRREGFEELLCVPNEFLDENWVPQRCTGMNLLGGEPYQGVCLPDCLRLPFEFTLDAAACPDALVCAPCIGPLGNPTGAPGCD